MAELYMVEFKGSRKEFFYNTYYHSLKQNEYVIIQAERGEDIGLLTKKVNVEISFDDNRKPRSILRRASDQDMKKYEAVQQKELQHKEEVDKLITRHKLVMKIVDIEWQYDGNKMTVFFTADHRVDFRELVKDLAANFKTRIELRQIGVRDEARRLGGIGICGLRQCCNTIITEFKPITTQHARDQDLPLNPSKISGNCGRLLCCLRYEAATYDELKKKFPQPGSHVKTTAGDGIVERIDIFNEEAVIRTEEGVLIRSSEKDILQVGKSLILKKDLPKSAIDELAEDVDDIRKLDDTE